MPPQGRARVIGELHEAHPGIARMKALATSLVWWPGTDADLEDKVKTCSICQESSAVPAEDNLHPWDWPEKPWSRLHLDYAGPLQGKMFLVIINAHSKWMLLGCRPRSHLDLMRWTRWPSRHWPACPSTAAEAS